MFYLEYELYEYAYEIGLYGLKCWVNMSLAWTEYEVVGN